jgi:hypothetical protein
MISRAVATMAMWGVVLAAFDHLIGSLRYIIHTPVADGEFQRVISEVVMMPMSWQITVSVLLLALVIGAVIGTVFIWRGAVERSSESPASGREASKIKRERRERIAHLMETLDEDELAALEESRLSDDGEVVSIQELLDKEQRYTRR